MKLEIELVSHFQESKVKSKTFENKLCLDASETRNLRYFPNEGFFSNLC